MFWIAAVSSSFVATEATKTLETGKALQVAV